MTIEQILGYACAEQLESFSDAQLLEWFGPVLPVTRPEAILKQSNLSTKPRQSSFDKLLDKATAGNVDTARKEMLKQKAKELGLEF